MKSILISLLLIFPIWKNNTDIEKISGKYRVEFDSYSFNNSYKNSIIDFNENDYYIETNLKGETISKGKFEHNKNGIIILKKYLINNKNFQPGYTQIWFTNKDTIRFGVYDDNEPHFSKGGGIMVKVKN